MPRATWLADVLRADGLHVIELEGWQGRGRDDIDPQAVICHHTATGPGWSDESVVRLLRDGRPDLKGPLSQLGLRRDGTFDLIAAGRANHNGYGKYGNDSIGIEAYNDGQGERWPADQLDAFERGSAAILRHLGLPVSRCIGHKESDPTRKVDPRDVDMNSFRSKVARHITAPPPEPPTPVPAPADQEDDDDMRPHFVKVGSNEYAAFVFPSGRVVDGLDSELTVALDAVYIRKVANARQVDVVQSFVNKHGLI